MAAGVESHPWSLTQLTEPLDSPRSLDLMRDWLRDHRAALLAALWIVGVGVGLVSTLDSLSHDDFDGLNNMFQIPFALPWFLLPIAALTNSHLTDAWITAGMGLVNAVIVYRWIQRKDHPQASN